MKKLLLGLGSIAAVVAPVAAVISCGDDSTTPATNPGTNGTQAHVETITDATTVTAVKDGLNASLGLTKANIGKVEGGNDLSLSYGNAGKTMNFAKYTKVTFTANDTIHPGGSLTAVPVAAGDSLVIGTIATAKRTAGALKIMHIAKNGSNMLVDVDAAKRTQLQTAVVDKVTAHIEASKPGTDTTTPATATDLTAAGASVWHGLFHKDHGRSLPAVGTKLEVTVNNVKLTYTWAQADTDALAGYTADPHTMGQTAVLNHLATKLKAATATTVSDIIAAFGVGHLHNHDMAIVAGQAKATVALTAPAAGAKIKLSDVVSAVWTNANFGTSTTAADITLNGATLQVTFSANATPDDITTAINTAVTSNSAFTNCFDAS